jgi:hypothetical protein
MFHVKHSPYVPIHRLITAVSGVFHVKRPLSHIDRLA